MNASRFPADLNADVKGSEAPCNEAARRLTQESGVTVNDLWAFTRPQLDLIQERGNPHFHAKGSQVLAKEIAGVIQEALGKPR